MAKFESDLSAHKKFSLLVGGVVILPFVAAALFPEMPAIRIALLVMASPIAVAWMVKTELFRIKYGKAPWKI